MHLLLAPELVEGGGAELRVELLIVVSDHGQPLHFSGPSGPKVATMMWPPGRSARSTWRT